MLEDVLDAGSNIDVSGKGQPHKRPFHNNRVGSNRQSKENGGQ